MSTLQRTRLPYDDPSTPHEMYDDCAAAGGNLGYDRLAPRAPEPQRPVAGAHARFHVSVPSNARRLARDLRLSLD